jgi:hypothetical protein
MSEDRRPKLVWHWSLPPRKGLTLEHILGKIANAQERVVISSTAFTLKQVIEALKKCQAPEKTVLIGRHDFRRIQTRMLAAVHLVKEVVGAVVVENRRDQTDTLWRSGPATAGG